MQPLQHFIKLVWNMAVLLGMFVFIGYWTRAHPLAMVFGLVAFWCLTFGAMRWRSHRGQRKQRA